MFIGHLSVQDIVLGARDRAVKKIDQSLFSQTTKSSWGDRQLTGDLGFPDGTVVKNPPANAGDTVQALVREDPTCRGATKPIRHNY